MAVKRARTRRTDWPPVALWFFSRARLKQIGDMIGMAVSDLEQIPYAEMHAIIALHEDIRRGRDDHAED